MIEDIRIKLLNRFFDFFASKEAKLKRFIVLYGGAGSGKSYSVAIKIALICATYDNVQCLVTRKTFPALRITAYPLILEVLAKMHIPHQHNKSSSTITFANGSTMLFKSMDDPEKIKSLNLDLVWIEEATDYNYEDFLQINLRLRNTNLKINQCYLTFNPIDEFHWLNTELLQKRKKECAIHQSTYKDNRFLPRTYTDELENLKDFDENHYRIYAEGLFGRLENVIYRNWQIVKEMPSPRYDAYGLDFGFTQPACLVGLVMKDGNPFVKELLYETNLENTELIARLKIIINRKMLPIYADPSRPESIAALCSAGFNCLPADNSVWEGIKSVRARPLCIHESSVNLIKEIRSYSWRKDKNGRILEEPVKFRDHAVDAVRYLIHNYWGGRAIPGSINSIRENLRKQTFDADLAPMSSGMRSKTPTLDW